MQEVYGVLDVYLPQLFSVTAGLQLKCENSAERPGESKCNERQINMDKKSRKELLEQYKQIKTFMGVYQIKNNVNGKIYIESFLNFKNRCAFQ